MQAPLFSIIIPTYNRNEQLSVCLQAITCLEYPAGRFEVIVIDDGGNEPVESVVDPYRGRLKIDLLIQPNAGPAHARNSGAVIARGDYLAFIDDDCLCSPGWLATIAERLQAAPDAAIGGYTVNGLKDNPYARASQHIQDRVYTHYNSAAEEASFFATNNLVLPRDRFLAMGGFDSAHFPSASEDRDFCDRWIAARNRMIYHPNAIVYHEHNLSLARFMAQHFRYGRGAFRFHLVCRQRNPDHIAFQGGFYRDLLRDLIGRNGNRYDGSMTALLLLWQAANAAGYLWERLTHAVGKDRSAFFA